MIKPSHSPVAIGFVFAIISAALFAIRPIFVKLVYAQGVDPATLLAFRMIFSAPIYIALLFYFLSDSQRRARLNGKNIAAISAIGMLGYFAASFLDLLGLQYVTAQLGRMILYVYPTFVVLLGALYFSKPITFRIILSLIITYSGIALIFGHDLTVFGEDVVTGALYILGSALTFSLYLLYSKALIEQVGSRIFTSIALISASVGILSYFTLTHSITETINMVNAPALWLILIIAIFCTVIPTFFTAAAVARIGPDRTGIAAMIGPGFTSVFAVVIINEDFTIYHIIGITLTVIGVGVLQRR